MSDTIVSRLSRVLQSIDNSVPRLATSFIEADDFTDAVSQGYFRPEQNEIIATWFAEFLALRASAWEIIDETHTLVKVGLDNLETFDDYRYFIIGYTAACTVVRLDRILLEQIASHTFVQRKLNEGFPEKLIPRKQFTRIYNSFVDVDNAYRMQKVMNFASRERNKIKSLSGDEFVGPLVNQLWRFRSYLDPSKQNYFMRGAHFLKHAIRRRGATIKQHTEFKILEASGRIFSEIVNKKGKLVSKEVREQARNLLRPGDVMVTRHKYALTNFFLPGYWPHAALYVGSNKERKASGIQFPFVIEKKLDDKHCTFEALKDGVLFRNLESTLSVDGFVILRPNLSNAGIKQAIERIAEHEGKQYNFDFDFFRSDRLVCTELIFRAFDGIESINIPLVERVGRPTLSAEDLLDLALGTEMFAPVAIYGAHKHYVLETEKDRVIKLIEKSYKTN